MTASAGTTTIEIPLPLRARLAAHREHPRQAYHEIIARALDAVDGRAKPGELDALVASKQKELRRAAKANRLSRIWLFGSRARGTARPDSDVDILYQAEPGASLFDVAGFLAGAQDMLGMAVEIADIDRLASPLRERILEDAVPI